MKTESLTALRFVAASVVVIFHFGQSSQFFQFAPGFFNSGPQMVTFFFVLSGFVMAVAYGEREEFAAHDYYVNRIARIAPVYFLALGLSALLFLGYSRQQSYIGLLLSVFFLQAWVPEYAASINGPAWSLSVEMLFYALFPLVITYFRRWGGPFALLVSLLIWVATQVVLIKLLRGDPYITGGTNQYALVHFFPLSHLCSFLMGVAGGLLAIRYRSFQLNGLPSYALLIVTLALIFFVLNNFTEQISPTIRLPLRSSFLSPLFLMLIFSFVFSHNAMTRLFSSRPAVMLGEASYALYILQLPVWYVYERKLLAPLHIGGSEAFLVFFVAYVGFSLLVYWFFERKAQVSIKALLKRH